MTAHPPTAPRRTLSLLGGLALGLATFVAVLLAASVFPAAKGSPNNLPIGVAAPAAAAGQVTSLLDARAPGAFDVRSYPDEASLRDAIRRRDVYGGISLSTTGRSVLIASAASPAVAQALTALAAALSQGGGPAPTVVDVVPLPESDPRGVGLAGALLPLLIGAVAPVLALTRLTRRTAYRVAGVLLASVTIGYAAAAVLHFGTGSLAGSFLVEGAAMSLTLLAAALVLLGLHAAAGMPGLGLGVLVLLLLGNPLSGATTAPEFLGQPWRGIGQWLTPGAGGQLLRSVAFFDGAGASGPLLVLGVWVVLGVALIVLGAVRGRAQSSSKPSTSSPWSPSSSISAK